MSPSYAHKVREQSARCPQPCAHAAACLRARTGPPCTHAHTHTHAYRTRIRPRPRPRPLNVRWVLSQDTLLSPFPIPCLVKYCRCLRHVAGHPPPQYTPIQKVSSRMLGTAPGMLVGVVKRAVLDQVRIEARSRTTAACSPRPDRSNPPSSPPSPSLLQCDRRFASLSY